MTVPEAKLSEGFQKPPVNAQKRNIVPNIPEEQLTTFDRNVLELKDIPVCRKHQPTEDEEEEEEEQDDDNEKVNHNCGLEHLNYDQIRYYPQNNIDPRFVVKQFESEDVSVDDPKPIQEFGDCGYKPGRVVDDDNNDDQRDEYNGYVVEDDGDEIVNYEGFI